MGSEVAAVHDKQRILPGGSPHAEAIRWLKRINERYEEMGLDPVLYHVEALITTTRAALDIHQSTESSCFRRSHGGTTTMPKSSVSPWCKSRR